MQKNVHAKKRCVCVVYIDCEAIDSPSTSFLATMRAYFSFSTVLLLSERLAMCVHVCVCMCERLSARVCVCVCAC